MRRISLSITLLLLIAIAVWFLFLRNTDTHSEDFQARNFRGSSGHSLPYRLFVPASYTTTETYPLIIYLHGQAGRGTDNVKQISRGNFPGSHTWTQPDIQTRHPAFVVAPQSKNGWVVQGAMENLSAELQSVVALTDSLCNEFPIDRNRLYILGQSVGGFAVWSLIHHRSNLFAAAVPIAWGAYSQVTETKDKIPLWTFSGDRDGSVKLTRKLVDSLRQRGWNVKYTEFADVGHVIWDRVYKDPDLQEWLFKQKRDAN